MTLDPLNNFSQFIAAFSFKNKTKQNKTQKYKSSPSSSYLWRETAVNQIKSEGHSNLMCVGMSVCVRMCVWDRLTRLTL